MARTILCDGELSIVDYRCDATPADKPFAELHQRFSLSYVRRGSFACQSHGRVHELVAGSFLIGYPGDEFTCSHDHHHCRDECLSFQMTPALAETLGDDRQLWRFGAAPPLAELIMLGELAQRTAERRTDLGLREVGLSLVSRFIAVLTGITPERKLATARDRRRALLAARWIEAHAHEEIGLDESARQSGLSPFHFLRVFKQVLGVTPHQHLLRCRLRNAAGALLDGERSITDIAFDAGFNDFSNFVRSFHRAAGVSPRAYRRLGAPDRKIVQERLSTPALP